jgi:hypothetical protein
MRRREADDPSRPKDTAWKESGLLDYMSVEMSELIHSGVSCLPKINSFAAKLMHHPVTDSAFTV